MIIENNILTAEEGYVLTNGETYGKQVFLSTYDSPNNWHEILENEVPNIVEEPHEEDLEELAMAARILLDL